MQYPNHIRLIIALIKDLKVEREILIILQKTEVKKS